MGTVIRLPSGQKKIVKGICRAMVVVTISTLVCPPRSAGTDAREERSVSLPPGGRGAEGIAKRTSFKERGRQKEGDCGVLEVEQCGVPLVGGMTPDGQLCREDVASCHWFHSVLARDSFM